MKKNRTSKNILGTNGVRTLYGSYAGPEENEPPWDDREYKFIDHTADKSCVKTLVQRIGPGLQSVFDCAI